MSGTDRRSVLWLLGASPVGAHASAPRSSPSQTTPYVFFSVPDATFVRAAVDRLIPADEYPSASQAGVVTYIDRQLAGDYGRGERMYLAQPHRPGTPQQGYQLGFSPAQLYRESLDALASDPRGQAFADTPPERQDALLRELEAGQWMLGRVPSSVFFETLLTNAIEGYFADPMYGGNAGMAGWRMIGFPGAYAHYSQWVGRHNMRFDRPPIGIASVPAHGHHHGHGHGPGGTGDPRIPASARPAPRGGNGGQR